MMAQSEKLVYPPGVRDITEDISTDDLVRRLKDCAQAFQNMSQDDDNAAYIPLALHFASETFLEHPSQDVRLLVACCIADVFRVYAPDAPYKDLTQLKIIFEFFVEQLRGLEDPSKPTFKRYFYLLENFSCVKTFNICVELEDNQKILVHLFKLMFKIINVNHSAKVKKFMLDMLSPLISEADIVSQELLDVILSQIIDPIKSKNRIACSLSQDILKKNTSSLEPYIQAFFNNALILGKTLQSNVARHLYELIYELNAICPSMLITVLPQLEFKLKSTEEKERLDITQVLARMFSDNNSTMIEENKTLWSCFLARFNDISPLVRIRCVQYTKNFLLNHPESIDDITEQFKVRLRDPDENVRYEVVLAILSTAKENFSCINEELLSFVKERTLDKKFKIRKEALLGLAMLYRQHNKGTKDLTPFQSEFLSWVKNKVLHAYYQTSMEDKLLVERILHTCIVPYQKPMEERMKLLYQLFCSVDEPAVRAFKEIMKNQSLLRTQVKNILEVITCEKNDNRQKTVESKVSLLSKNLQDPTKSKEYIMKFCNDLESTLKLRTTMSYILNGNISCAEAEAKVKEILKTLGHPVQTNTYYMIIKQLLERIAPVMVDKEGIRHLVDCTKDALLGECAIEAELGLQHSAQRGLELLWVLTFVFSKAFHDEYIYNNLLLFLHVEDEVSADMALQIFMNISTDMEANFFDFSSKLLPILENFVETGTAKQAKHAVYCINSIVSDKEKVFGNIIENLKKHFTLKSQYFRTALVSVGHIAYLCHDMFAADFKTIVAKIVVKDLLMLDQDLPRGGDETWGPLDSLPDETKVKIEGMKVMVRWLAGLKDMVQPAMSTLRLLTTVILHDGDLMERQHTAPVENSWMRLSAATCMLKLCQEPNYANVITLDQFQVLAYVINDKCPEVKDRFAQKVHKGLLSLKLPLEFLAIFGLCALDERKDFRVLVKNYLIINIKKRKDYIKQSVLSGDKLRALLPDYALPFAVHLLAHCPLLKTYNDVSALTKLKECLWLLMEPLMVKNENYSFSFFKRLLENIKQTKDKQAPDDVNTNMKLYAVCDLALSIVMSKTTNFVLKEFPVEPALPSKLFTDPDPNYSNFKTYLPPELVCDKPLKTGFEIDLFEDPNNAHPTAQNESSVAMDSMCSQIDESISSIASKENESVSENISQSIITKTSLKSKAKKQIGENNTNLSESVLTEENVKSDSASEEHETEINSRPIRSSRLAAKSSSDDNDKQMNTKEKQSGAKSKQNRSKDKQDSTRFKNRSNLKSKDDNDKNKLSNGKSKDDSVRYRLSEKNKEDSAKNKLSNEKSKYDTVEKNKVDSVRYKVSNIKVIQNSASSRHSRSRDKDDILSKQSNVNDWQGSIVDRTGKLKEKRSITKDNQMLAQKRFVHPRQIRSSRSSGTSSNKSSIISECGSSIKQNGILLSEIDIGSLCMPDLQNSLKECNVSLRKDEVEEYIARSNFITNSGNESSLSGDEFQENPAKRLKSKKVEDSSAVLKKRKLEDSSSTRSIKIKTSAKISERQVRSYSPSKDKTVLKSKTNLSSMQSPPKNSTFKKINKMPLVNGSREGKVSSKGSNPQNSTKSPPKLSTKRNQRNQIKTNLRKR